MGEETLTLDQARDNPDFGSLVPVIVPEGFGFTSATRLIDGARERDELNLLYEAGLCYVRLSIARETPGLFSRIVDPNRPEHYDMSLCPVPWAESVPQELREKLLHPVFRREDLTLEILRARAYRVEDAGDDNTGFCNNSMSSAAVRYSILRSRDRLRKKCCAWCNRSLRFEKRCPPAMLPAAFFNAGKRDSYPG